ncbi:MAG: DUF4861 family protein [Opitutaceae bacterium]|nr:DUF4861 family protein [Opitutaceae bacterium]MBP9912205.1 DUF4861 family protein [Opitutaceae bacterium]
MTSKFPVETQRARRPQSPGLFLRVLAAFLAASLSPSLAAAASLTVTVSHDLAIARPAETIVIPWREVAQALPGARLQHLAVRDAAGQSLPYQVTNVAPLVKDPQNLGVAYGELIFQHDFAAGEKSAGFTVEQTENVAPVFPTKAYGRYVQERLDDFAWENDRIAHRIYGPALAAAAAPGSGKEVLVTSGLDVWCKRVSYPIVDRWYNKGHDHYHTDEGEGMDLFSVGTGRGCGGTGVWDGTRLHVSRNYRSWRLLANGPVRVQFELTYDTWTTGGGIVSEVKRITLDAGHQLNEIESTFTVATGPQEITVGIGLNKNPASPHQDPRIAVTSIPAAGSLAEWVVQKTHGELGLTVIVPGPEFQGFATDELNQLVLARAVSGQPLRYLAGAGWSRAGEFTSQEAWDNYVAACAARTRAPVHVTLTTAP